jgi:hypothetical protein
MLRTVVFALFVGTVVAARASFEMMLLPGADDRIYRYDPVNNISLGSYRTSGATTMVSADLGGRSVSVRTGGSAFFKHFYSTGILENSISGTTGSLAIELVGNNLFVCTASSILKYNITTGALIGNQSAGTGITYKTMTFFNGKLCVFGVNSLNQTVSRIVDATTMSGTVVSTIGGIATAGSGFGKAAALFNSGSGAGSAAFTYIDSTAGLSYVRVPMASDATLTNTSASFTSTTTYSTTRIMPGFMAGHNSFYLYGQDATVATNARLTTYDFHTGFIIGPSITFVAGGGFGSSVTPYQGAILVAPEPGTMIGLGLGLAAILNRRRSRG